MHDRVPEQCGVTSPPQYPMLPILSLLFSSASISTSYTLSFPIPHHRQPNQPLPPAINHARNRHRHPSKPPRQFLRLRRSTRSRQHNTNPRPRRSIQSALPPTLNRLLSRIHESIVFPTRHIRQVHLHTRPLPTPRCGDRCSQSHEPGCESQRNERAVLQ